jgi:RNA polymerase sigma factor (TIGR02999 family)
VLSARDFESLLPWYVNGTLTDQERLLVTAYLRAHREQEARVQWNASLSAAVKQQAGGLPQDLGLKRALATMRPGEIMPLQETRPIAATAGDALPEEAGLRPVQPSARQGEITRLLQRTHAGDAAARNALFALAYEELKKLAHVRLYHGGRHDMLDTTALVSEAYIRFIQSAELRAEDRRSFFAFASQVMRNVIVDTARGRLAQRRGGGVPELTLSTQLLDQLSAGEEAILDVHEALLVLEAAEPRLAKLVEMRYYGGYTEAEIAETLGVNERTVQRDWNKARLLLKAVLKPR